MGKTTKRLKKVGGVGLVVAAGGALAIGGLLAIRQAFTSTEEGGWGIPGLDTLIPEALKDMGVDDWIPELFKGKKRDKDDDKDPETGPIKPNPIPGLPGDDDKKKSDGGGGGGGGGTSGEIQPRHWTAIVGDIALGGGIAAGAAGLTYGGYKLATSKPGQAAIKSISNKATGTFAKITGRSTKPFGITGKEISPEGVQAKLIYDVHTGKPMGVEFESPSGKTTAMPFGEALTEKLNTEGYFIGKAGPRNTVTGKPQFVAPGLAVLGAIPMIILAIQESKKWEKLTQGMTPLQGLSKLFGTSLPHSVAGGVYDEMGNLLYTQTPRLGDVFSRAQSLGGVMGVITSPAAARSFATSRYNQYYAGMTDKQGRTAAPATGGASDGRASAAAARRLAQARYNQYYAQQGGRGGGGGASNQGTPGGYNMGQGAVYTSGWSAGETGMYNGYSGYG